MIEEDNDDDVISIDDKINKQFGNESDGSLEAAELQRRKQ